MKTQKNFLSTMHKASKWGFVFSIMLLIFSVSNQEASRSSELSESVLSIFTNFFNISPNDTLHLLIRKLAHLTIYALLGFFIVNALVINTIKPKDFLVALAICVLYAMSDEFHQTFIPGRSGEVSDVMIDTLGSILGITMYQLIKPLIKD